MKKTFYLLILILSLVVACSSATIEPSASLPDTNAGTHTNVSTDEDGVIVIDQVETVTQPNSDSHIETDMIEPDDDKVVTGSSHEGRASEVESSATEDPTPVIKSPSGGGDDGGGEDPMPAEAFIRLHRTGGFAGLDDTWTFYADGCVIDNHGNAGTVDAETLSQMWAIVNSGEFFTYKGEYVPKDTCCDLFTYEVTVSDGGLKMHTVITMDTAVMPAGLQNLLMQINHYLSQQSSPTNHDAPIK